MKRVTGVAASVDTALCLEVHAIRGTNTRSKVYGCAAVAAVIAACNWVRSIATNMLQLHRNLQAILKKSFSHLSPYVTRPPLKEFRLWLSCCQYLTETELGEIHARKVEA